jgi:E3 ubiquitin-protein ligase HECTD1
MSSSSRESSTAPVTATVVPPSLTSTEVVEGEIEKEKKEDSTIEEKEESNEPKGDPEVAPIYLKQLLPVFTNLLLKHK